MVHVLTATSVTGIIQMLKLTDLKYCRYESECAKVFKRPTWQPNAGYARRSAPSHCRVSEPVVLLYGYMYSFGRDRPGLGSALFLAWAAWVCNFAGAMLIILAVTNACLYTARFTRMAGEIFGMLIAVLFMQEAIRSPIKEFRKVDNAG